MTSTSSKIKLVKNNKLDCLYNKETSLVFKSAKEKLVIGRIENETVIPLDQRAVELCEENGFDYDESLVTIEEASGEENGDEEDDNGEPSVKETRLKSVVPEQKDKGGLKESSKEAKEPAKEARESPKETRETPRETKEPAKEARESSKETRESTPVKTSQSSGGKTLDEMKGIGKMLVNYAEEIEKFVSHVRVETSELEQQVVSLTKERDDSRKELEDTKKKMKAILAAMQGEL